ncbi:MAG: integrase [Rhodanobacter sp.]|nr:MAG: integrase [Rhodanobacter sp.]
MRALTVDQRPALDAKGRTTLVANQDRAPYRFTDHSPGAPLGMSIYVGGRGARYEVRVPLNGKELRYQIGPVAEWSLEDAHLQAATLRKSTQALRQDARVVVQAEDDTQAARKTTVGDAMRSYIDFLTLKIHQEKGKESGVIGARNALARLARPEVGLADVPIADLTDQRVRKAWVDLRVSAMSRSNRLGDELREKLLAYKDKKGRGWWELTREELHKLLGLEGKQVALAFAAGLASAEHTMGDAARAVERVLHTERGAASNAGRPVALTYNPFSVLRADGYYRSTRMLRRHYEAARIRNPLGVDDDEKGTKSLPTVLKAIVGRRDQQGGHNAAGVDYLLLMLLWGTRKAEITKLMWYEAVSKDDREATPPRVSWVWLAPKPTARNPTTGYAGSQVFIHDTKNGDSLLFPVAYFASRVMAWRAATREGTRARLQKVLAEAEEQYMGAKVGSMVRTEAFKAKERAEWRLAQVDRWVFPARNPKAAEGHYTDSKSIIDNVRFDSGIEVGLTPHDFRRTMGRMAAKLLPGHIVSQLLHHTRDDDPEAMAKVSERYSVAEWSTMQEAMEKIDESIIATSPRVWNILKNSDRPRLDEANDPEVVIPTWRANHGRKTKPEGSDDDAPATPSGQRRAGSKKSGHD